MDFIYNFQEDKDFHHPILEMEKWLENQTPLCLDKICYILSRLISTAIVQRHTDRLVILIFVSVVCWKRTRRGFFTVLLRHYITRSGYAYAYKTTCRYVCCLFVFRSSKIRPVTFGLLVKTYVYQEKVFNCCRNGQLVTCDKVVFMCVKRTGLITCSLIKLVNRESFKLRKCKRTISVMKTY